ncbi:MAG TPA: PDZ domain-containing protein, partial [Flavobacteriales bacterium]|nr:PDZ domain-containing protein [Flavobacteriales bacterium]
PNENTNNRTISYYPKGSLIAAMLDIEIIASTNGKMKLDDLLRKLYNDFYKVKKTGYTFADFKAAAENICGKKMDDFFNTLVLTASDVNYNQYLNKVGYMLIATARGNEPWLGIQTKDGAGGKVMISAVSDGSCAQNSGLMVNDEIIAVSNTRVDNNTLYRFVGSFPVGTTLEFLIARDNLIQTVNVKLDKSYMKDFVITAAETVTKDVKALRDKWLN